MQFGALGALRRKPRFCPAPTLLSNQALKPIPKAKRTQIVHGHEDQQSEYESDSAAECPVERLGTDRTAPNALNRIPNEDILSAIQRHQSGEWGEDGMGCGPELDETSEAVNTADEVPNSYVQVGQHDYTRRLVQ